MVGCVLVVVPLALSYSLDHQLLWRVDGVGVNALEGHRLRGKVAVVLEGHRGLGLQVARGLQALGATVVTGCPDRDTCARTMTMLAQDFTPASGAWAITPMKLNICSLRSIRNFAAAVAEKYEHVDLLVLDSESSCASNSNSAMRLGDGAACPQAFMAHVALLRWLRPLLLALKEGGAAHARDAARVVGVTGPLHWLARVKDTEELTGGAEEGPVGVGKLVEVLWQQGVHAMVPNLYEMCAMKFSRVSFLRNLLSKFQVNSTDI